MPTKDTDIHIYIKNKIFHIPSTLFIVRPRFILTKNKPVYQTCRHSVVKFLYILSRFFINVTIDAFGLMIGCIGPF
jgi:hypothetical protein